MNRLTTLERESYRYRLSQMKSDLALYNDLLSRITDQLVYAQEAKAIGEFRDNE